MDKQSKLILRSVLLSSFMMTAAFAGAKASNEVCKEGVCALHLKNMYLSYQMQADKNIKFTLSAKTTGWVAVGFGANNTMTGAVMVLGYVDADGKVQLSQEYGVKGRPPHKSVVSLGGVPEVKLVSGKVEKGQTTISFTLPMTPSSAKYNYTFTQGEDIPIILAYGKNGVKNFTSYHQYRTSAEIKLPK
ncbi:DOMON domain-containing protein [Cysteiniphilum sp. 6C5]|uniref:DOMON domain-containing protein n=1 Tax=unclassified Cysteiniphilum TaxID=2610889 RepID=UPI003F85C0E6